MAAYNNRRHFSNRRRRRRAKPKQFSQKMRITLFAIFCVCLFAFGLLLFKIYRINRDDGDRYKKEALSQQSYTNAVLNFQRGDIKDRNDTTLAVSVRKYNLVLEPRTLLSNEEKKIVSLNAISKFFGVEKSVLENIIEKRPKSMYEKLDSLKELSSDQVEKFQ